MPPGPACCAAGVIQHTWLQHLEKPGVFRTPGFSFPQSDRNISPVFAAPVSRTLQRPKMPISLQSGSLNADINLPDNATVFHVSGQGAQVLQSSLQVPLGLPGLAECVVGGDRVTLAIDPSTTELPRIVASVWEELHAGTQTELSVTIVLPQDPQGLDWADLLDQIPEHIRSQAAVHVHDPDDESERQYLASSAGGERIYLSKHVVDADLIITIGTIAFDGVLGYRGTNSTIYPQLSDSRTIAAASGQGHAELIPDNKRPLRELVDEIGWLLGTQYSVQVIPDSTGLIGFSYSGSPEQVMKAGQSCLRNHWWYKLQEPADVTIVTVPPTVPQHAWKQLGSVLESAVRITEDGGRILICAELPAPESPGLTMLQRCSEPADLIKPLKLEPTPDARETLQLINAAGRNRLLLFSNLDATITDDLGILAIDSESEVQKIVSTAHRCVVIQGANFWAEIE